MSFLYTRELIDKAFTYAQYREGVAEGLRTEPTDEAARKIRPYAEYNAGLMDKYDVSYTVHQDTKTALEAAPATIWLVLTEGWCGDAAFNVPMMAAIEKLVPHKVSLRLLLRDQNLELMDAHLTDGGRSIPKLIVLSEDLKELATWGPRPEKLQALMKQWKSEGLGMNEIIPKVRDWYDADETRSLQSELTALTKNLKTASLL